MRIVPASLVEYENSLPATIQIMRNVPDPTSGHYQVTIRDYKGMITHEGIISDKAVLKLMEDFEPYV